MIRVAVIDDGVCPGVFKNCTPDYTFRINSDGRVKEYSCKSRKITHGTVCAAIISELVVCEMILYSVKIKPFNGNGSVDNLIKAIDFCVANDINVINLSLGSTDKSDELIIYPSVLNAVKNGVIIVSAISNENVETYPASFSSVISVKHSVKAKLGIYYCNMQNQFTIGAYGKITLSLCNGEQYTTDASNSFATAVVTAKIVNIIELTKTHSLEQIKKKLFSDCINTDS